MCDQVRMTVIYDNYISSGTVSRGIERTKLVQCGPTPWFSRGHGLHTMHPHACLGLYVVHLCCYNFIYGRASKTLQNSSIVLLIQQKDEKHIATTQMPE